MVRCAGIRRGGRAGAGVSTVRVPATAKAATGTAARSGVSFAAALDRLVPPALALLVGGWFALFTAMSLYWRDHLRWGFDILVYSQPIWNTAHRRIWETSIYSFTTSELGHDVVLLELLLAPFYRLVGSNLALVLAQSAAVALGGVGAYAAARVALPRAHRLVPLLFAALYLSLLFVQRTTLDEFKSRNMVMFAWFFAWVGYRTRRTWLIWAVFALALTTRSDVALVVAAFGVYGHLSPLRGTPDNPRRPFAQTWLPMIVGGAWFALVQYVVVPQFSARGFIYTDNYGWLGGSLSGIITNTLTRPLYVLDGMLTPEKLRYTFDLLLPFAFLPLLRPKILLIPLPIYALNMLSSYENQTSITHHYQALIVPFLTIAAIEAVAWFGGRRFAHPAIRHSAIAAALVGVMLLCSAVQQLTITSPVLSYIAHHERSPRAEAGRELLAQVPPDAPLAITQKLAGMMPDRRSVYSFPGDPKYHDPALIARADYLIGDTQLSADEMAAIARYRGDAAWRVVDERGGFVLMQRIGGERRAASRERTMPDDERRNDDPPALSTFAAHRSPLAATGAGV